MRLDASRLAAVGPENLSDLTAFLELVDLTVSGLDSPQVRLWTVRDDEGRILASTGFELSGDGRHALIRSVAVHPEHRAAGAGTTLATAALDGARAVGAEMAWLFSRRSGPFWQRLGFAAADREALAAALADTHQVRLFRHTGQLDREVAWSRPLTR